MASTFRKIRNRLLNTDVKRSLEKIESQNMELTRGLEEARSQIHSLKKHNEVFTDISAAPTAKGSLRLQQQGGAKILEIFDQICFENNLTYWLGAGNLIGIVRHNGEAVPWDDDVDVYMPRDDFEKSINVLTKAFEGSDFGFVNRGFSLKLARYKTTAISFDIFPIDQYYKNIETDEEFEALHSKITQAGVYTVSEWMTATGYGPNWDDFLVPIWEGGDVKTPDKIKKLKEESLKKWQKSLMENNLPAEDGHLVKGYERAAFPAKQYSWKYDWVFPLRREKYMGVEVNIPNNPDKYLRSQYGDYLGMPNDFHRHTSHFASKYEKVDDLECLITTDLRKSLSIKLRQPKKIA